MMLQLWLKRHKNMPRVCVCLLGKAPTQHIKDNWVIFYMFAERLRHIPFCFTDLLRKNHQNSRHQLPSFVESFRQFWSVTYLCWLLSMIVDCVAGRSTHLWWPVWSRWLSSSRLCIPAPWSHCQLYGKVQWFHLHCLLTCSDTNNPHLSVN